MKLGLLTAPFPETPLADVVDWTAGTCLDPALYALDLTMLDGVPTSKLHGDQRYLAAPIALFYWNPEPGPGFPQGRVPSAAGTGDCAVAVDGQVDEQAAGAAGDGGAGDIDHCARPVLAATPPRLFA